MPQVNDWEPSFLRTMNTVTDSQRASAFRYAPVLKWTAGLPTPKPAEPSESYVGALASVGEEGAKKFLGPFPARLAQLVTTPLLLRWTVSAFEASSQ